MDKSIKKFVVILSVLAFVCLAAGWVFPGLMMLAIVAILIAESIQEKKKKARGEILGKGPLEKVDFGNEKLTDEEKIARMPVKIKDLRYQNEAQLNDILPKISALYGISLAVLWHEVNKAKDEMQRMERLEEEQFLRDFYIDEEEREEAIDDLELEDLDEEEQEELLEDLDEFDREELLDDLDDDDSGFGAHDTFDSHDSFDAHDTFDSHDSFDSDDAW